jgi:hypothetical protein
MTGLTMPTNYQTAALQIVSEQINNELLVLPSVPGSLYTPYVQTKPIAAHVSKTMEFEFDLTPTSVLEVIPGPGHQLTPTANTVRNRLMFHQSYGSAVFKDLFYHTYNTDPAKLMEIFAKNKEAMIRRIGLTQNMVIRNLFRANANVLSGADNTYDAIQVETFAAANSIAHDFNTLSNPISTDTVGLNPNKILRAIEVARETYNHYNQPGENQWYISTTSAMLRGFKQSLKAGTTQHLFQNSDFFVTGSMERGGNVTTGNHAYTETIRLDGITVTFIVDDELRAHQNVPNTTTTWYLPMWQPQGLGFGQSSVVMNTHLLENTVNTQTEVLGIHMGGVRGPLPYIFSIGVRG